MLRLKRFVMVTICVAMLMVLFAMPALARTIYGNGTGGIYIDIEASPYSDAWDPNYGNPYGTGGCTWFAEARTEQLTGINCAGIIYGVDQWYNTVYARFGFSRSQSLSRTNKSLICWSSPHIAVVEGFTSSGAIIISEGGVSGWGVNSSHGYCRIATFDSEDALKSKDGGFMGYIVLPVRAVGSTTSLDVNGYLDGALTGNTGDYGTFDVYINGSRVADDVNDYYNSSLSIGASYEIKDIRAKSEHTYTGVHSGSLSGTLTEAGANVRLGFTSYGTLEVKGVLDGMTSSDLSGFGNFSVIINETTMDEHEVTSYSKKWPQGTKFIITSINVEDGKYYEGSAGTALAGTIGKGTTTAKLEFSTMIPPTGEWREVDKLPAYISADDCEIQYQHTYTQTATTSPGEGWVQGAGTTTYVNDGGVYDSDFEMTTSNTRVHVGTYYYHYCYSGCGEVEHYNDGSHTVYHNVGSIDQFYTDWEGADSADSRYTAYRIKWKSGQWADGYAYCSLGSPAVYYRRYQYQNRKAVTNYTWTKTSDWETVMDPAAQTVRYRYRLRDTALPVIESLGITEVTPRGYTLSCVASDDNAITRVVFTSWTDSETEAEALALVVEPQQSGDAYEATATISIADHGNMRDCNYYTKVQAYDTAGNVVEYSGNAGQAYIPTLARSANKLNLPTGLLAIEESAFEGDIRIGEVTLSEGVNTIGARAFADCSRLVLVTVPDSVTEIDESAFEESGNVVLMCSADSAAAIFARANGIPYLTAE